MLTEIIQGLVQIGYAIYQVIRAIVICGFVFFALIMIGEVACHHSPPTSESPQSP